MKGKLGIAIVLLGIAIYFSSCVVAGPGYYGHYGYYGGYHHHYCHPHGYYHGGGYYR